MSPKSESAEQHIKSVKRGTRRKYSAEEKIRIVLEGMRGEHSIAELCRREGVAQSQYDSWSKDFMEAGKKRLAGDTRREARSDEVWRCAERCAISRRWWQIRPSKIACSKKA